MLRNRLLKTSAGKTWINTIPYEEKKDIHLAAIQNRLVVGTLMLSKISEQIIQVKQVAVDTRYQGSGVGKKLLGVAENIADSLGFKTVILNGRSQAWAFYEYTGYKSEGDAYYDGQVLLKKFIKEIVIPKNQLLIHV